MDFQGTGDIFLRTLLLFVAVIIYTRLLGLRSFSKISSFDFAMTIAIGSTISAGILNKSNAFIPSLLGLLCLFIIQWLFAFGRKKIILFSNAIDNMPLLLLRNGEFLEKNMLSANITKEDVIAKIRESGAPNHLAVGAVVFETTGTISVIRDNDIHPEILKNVRQ